MACIRKVTTIYWRDVEILKYLRVCHNHLKQPWKLEKPCITKRLATCHSLGLIFPCNKALMVDPVLFLLFAVFTSSQIQLVFNICRHTQNFEGQWGRFFLRRMSCENQTKRECPDVLEVHFWGYKRLTRQFLWGFSGNLHSPKDFVFDFFLDRGFLPNHDQGGGSSPQHNDAASLCSRCGGDPNKILKGNHVVKCDVKTPIQRENMCKGNT